MNVKRMLAAVSTCLLVTTSAAACGKDLGVVKEVRVEKNPKGDDGVVRTLVVRLNDGDLKLDGPYLTKKGIGKCAVGSSWPSCLDK